VENVKKSETRARLFRPVGGRCAVDRVWKRIRGNVWRAKIADQRKKTLSPARAPATFITARTGGGKQSVPLADETKRRFLVRRHVVNQNVRARETSVRTPGPPDALIDKRSGRGAYIK